MLGKKINVFVVPEGADRIKRYTLPRFLPRWGAFTAVVLVMALLVFSVHSHLKYSRLADQTSEINRLRQKASMQNVQILAFADKVRLLELEMAKLQQFDRKLRAITDDNLLANGEQSPLAMGGSDGEETAPAATLKANTVDLVKQMHRDLDRLLAEAGVEEQNQQELGAYLEDNKSMMACMPCAWPLNGPLTSYFGYRNSPFGGRRSEFHRGLDISAPTGAAIKCPADGVVVSTEWSSGYGRILSINHGYGVVTRYAHLSEYYVKSGQKVKRGEKIAAVGASGRVTGPHLHYEVILNGVPINPMRFLAAK